jgi:hypothetical protein
MVGTPPDAFAPGRFAHPTPPYDGIIWAAWNQSSCELTAHNPFILQCSNYLLGMRL